MSDTKKGFTPEEQTRLDALLAEAKPMSPLAMGVCEGYVFEQALPFEDIVLLERFLREKHNVQTPTIRYAIPEKPSPKDRTFEVVLALRYIDPKRGMVMRDGIVVEGGVEKAMALYRRMLDASRDTARVSSFIIKATHTGSFVATAKPIAAAEIGYEGTNWTSYLEHAHVFATLELAQAWCDEWNAERGRAEVEIIPHTITTGRGDEKCACGHSRAIHTSEWPHACLFTAYSDGGDCNCLTFQA